LIVELVTSEFETGRRSNAGIATETAMAIRYLERDCKVIKQDYYMSNADHMPPVTDFARVTKAEHRIE